MHIRGSTQRHRPTHIVKVGLISGRGNPETGLDMSKPQPRCHPLAYPVRVSLIPSIQSSPILLSYSPNRRPHPSKHLPTRSVGIVWKYISGASPHNKSQFPTNDNASSNRRDSGAFCSIVPYPPDRRNSHTSSVTVSFFTVFLESVLVD